MYIDTYIKKKLDLYLYFKWIIDINTKSKIIKFLKYKIGKYKDHWAGKDCKRAKIYNWNTLKLKTFIKRYH